MNERKRIGVLLADGQNDYHKITLDGIIAQSNALGYDVLVFTIFFNSEKDSPYQDGEETIFNLINNKYIDGIIFYKSSFFKLSLAEKLEQRLIKCNIPVVYIHSKSDKFQYVVADDRDIFKKLVLHMIETHHCTKIFCLTGPKDHWQAKERLLGYFDALTEHQIPIKSEYVFYGDYWKDAANKLAIAIVKGDVPRPEAVVCANYAMAIELCDTLIANGVQVPFDVAVSGFDEHVQNYVNVPSITTISGYGYNVSASSVCKLHELITGKPCKTILRCDEHLEVGQSCGCNVLDSKILMKYRKLAAEKDFYLDLYLTSNMMIQLFDIETIDELFRKMQDYAHIIRGSEEIYICLYENWNKTTVDVNDKYGNDKYRNNKYIRNQCSKRVLVNQIKGRNSSSGQSVWIDKEKLLPVLYEQRDPSAYYFLSIHYKDRCFGYSVISYGNNHKSFDKLYWLWSEDLNNVLEKIYIQNSIKNFNDCMQLIPTCNTYTDLYNQDDFEIKSMKLFHKTRNTGEKLLVFSDNKMIQNEDEFRVSNPYRIKMEQIRSRIYKDPTKKWSIDTFAKELQISHAYFQRLYKKTFGVSCITDVIYARINKAKKILTETDFGIEKTAYLCGYENEVHFMQQFKKITGITPSQYRKMHS